ncbi:MAG: rep, partial [Rhizobacter sp.]|nr:rep [Rhizobacter sp.]
MNGPAVAGEALRYDGPAPAALKAAATLVLPPASRPRLSVFCWRSQRARPLSPLFVSTPSAPATLNPAQLEAVHHLAGPCLVLAGAGSGKTRVITHKIARLLQADFRPSQIAAITFTNKAAAEMRERSKALIGARASRELVVCTFHALGVRILRQDGKRLGLKEQFSILDSDDVLGILR